MNLKARVLAVLAALFFAPVALADSPFSSYQQALPAANGTTAGDSLWIYQGGAAKQISVNTLAQIFGVNIPTIDINFANNLALGSTCTSVSACVTATNSTGGFVQWADGHYSAVAANTIRRSDQGILREPAGTNYAQYDRDLSQSVWTKTSLTSALSATGVDNTVNDASTLTATAANGTACQTMTAAAGSFGEFTYSVFLKRVTGSGEVDLSLETAPGHTGTTYYPITLPGESPALSTSWQRFRLTFDGMSNPTVCLRLVTSGDVVAADFVQVEPKVWATSPIYTTNATGTRSVDVVTLTSAASSLLNSGTATVIATESGYDVGNFRHQIASSSLGGSTFDLYGWQYAANAIFGNPGGTAAGNPPYAICGPTSTVDANQSLALPVVYGMTWSPTSFAMDCDGGGAFVGPGSAPATQTWNLSDGISGPTSYMSDLKLFNTSLSISALQAATTHSNKFSIADAAGGTAGEWNDFTAASGTTLVGGVNVPGGGGTQFTYAFETGLLSSGVTSPIQMGPVGNMIRFNMFANNCWVSDFCQIGGYGGSQRTELDGAGSAQFANGAEVWMSYSDCIEPGNPITSNWLITGQVHHTINSTAGGSPPFEITGKIGGYREIEYTNDGLGNYVVGYQWPIVRGKWENMVIDMIMDPTGATGKYKIWKNGVQIVNYTGVTGTVPNGGGTQNYYWKFGLYESQVPEYQAIRYANTTYSTTSLLAKVTAPDAIPAGYGTTCQ